MRRRTKHNAGLISILQDRLRHLADKPPIAATAFMVPAEYYSWAPHSGEMPRFIASIDSPARMAKGVSVPRCVVVYRDSHPLDYYVLPQRVLHSDRASVNFFFQFCELAIAVLPEFACFATSTSWVLALVDFLLKRDDVYRAQKALWVWFRHTAEDGDVDLAPGLASGWSCEFFPHSTVGLEAMLRFRLGRTPASVLGRPPTRRLVRSHGESFLRDCWMVDILDVVFCSQLMLSELAYELADGDRPRRTLVANGCSADQKRLIRRRVKETQQGPSISSAPSGGAGTTAPPGPELSKYVFRQHGDNWEVRYERESAFIRNLVGMPVIAKLLSNRNRPVSALDLCGSQHDLEDAPHSDQPAIDFKGKQAYKSRLDRIEEELAEAEKNNDRSRIDGLKEERRRFADELQKATGLGGRDRMLKASAPACKAAESVRKNLRTARSVIQKASCPRLAAHLKSSICQRSGTFAYYPQEASIDWVFS